MNSEHTVSIEVVLERDGKHSVLRDAAKPSARKAPARVAKQLAFALREREQLDRGELGDFSEAAEKYRVTRARISQLLNMTLLAPDIQETVLQLTALEAGKRITERSLRNVVKALDWQEQRKRWRLLSRQRFEAPATLGTTGTTEEEDECSDE